MSKSTKCPRRTTQLIARVGLAADKNNGFSKSPLNAQKKETRRSDTKENNHLKLQQMSNSIIVVLIKWILGEMVNLEKVNLPKSQPEHKITKMLCLVFLAS